MVMNGSDTTAIVFKRSKSTATPRRRGNNNDNHFLDKNYSYSPSRRGFWSFLYSTKHTTPKKKHDGHSKDLSFNTHTYTHTHTHTVGSSSSVVRKREDDDFVAVDENCIRPKVFRSRSVGCGSRSFSGDYFERISTGFGDCTLKRVESQREGGGNKPKGHGFLLPMIEKSSQNLGPGIMNMDMNMLPQLIGEETLNKSDSRTRSEKETGQMTIFYAGQVIVMDNFPADKAKEVMMFASKSSATFALPPMAQKPAESATGCLNIVSAFGLQDCARHIPQPALTSDLPIARKILLARFLEKGKDR